MAKKYKQPEIGKVYKEPQTLYVKGKNGIVKRVHPKDLRHYEAAGTITPKGMTSSRVFFIKVVPAEQRFRQQFKQLADYEGDVLEEGKKVFLLTVHVKITYDQTTRSPHGGRVNPYNSLYIEGYITRYVNEDYDYESVKVDLGDILRSAIADYFNLYTVYSNQLLYSPYWVYGNPETEEVDRDSTSGRQYEDMKYWRLGSPNWSFDDWQE